MIVDLSFLRAGTSRQGDTLELGFTGFGKEVPAWARSVSAWLPGDRPDEAERWTKELRDAGTDFRFLFPERYHAPSREARRLFAGKEAGDPIHLHVRVQARPDNLLHDPRRAPQEWLRDPVLNRLPLAVWMQGPVHEVRLLSSSRETGCACVVLLRHADPNRMSILEWSVSPDFAPGIADGFEATGRDGFLRVNGIWHEPWFRPRLVLHRGALETGRRDLPRDMESTAAAAAKAHHPSRKQTARSHALAAMYLDACRRVALVTER